jgi:tripartite-type tricarboxylate transporter receptor subunit TctC
MRRRVLALLLVLGLVPDARAYPDRPITLATGYAPGGSTDIAARMLADRLAANLGPGARVIVENRPGASGMVASEWLKRQPPDGYTIMLVESSSHAIAPNALVGGTRYDPLNDFTHLGVIATGPLILVVNKDFAGTTAPEVLETLRRAPPDTYAFASSGIGAIVHLAPEMLALGLGTHFVHVPYRSGGQMMTAIFQGEGQFGIAVLASAAPQVRDNMVRGIAVTGPKRFPSFPELPTFTEAGIKDADISTFNILLGPPGMPASVQAALNQALIGALAESALRERLLTAGAVAWEGPNKPADAQAFLAGEIVKFRSIVEKTGVRLEP